MHPVLGEDRHRQRDERAPGELHGGYRGGVPALEQPRLHRDEPGRQDDRSEYEQVPPRARAATAGARDEGDSDERDRVAGPGESAGRGLTEARGDQRDEHRGGADDDGRVAHAGPLDAGVLEHDHRAEPDRARREHPRRQRVANAAAADEREHGRGDREADDGQPTGGKPPERQLREGHVKAPQRAGCDEGEDR